MHAGRTYEDSILVAFDDRPQHFTSLIAFLVKKLCAYRQQSRERNFNNLVEISSLFSALETIDPADCEQALKTRKDGICIIRIQKLNGDVNVLWPFCWEVVLQDFGENGN